MSENIPVVNFSIWVSVKSKGVYKREPNKLCMMVWLLSARCLCWLITQFLFTFFRIVTTALMLVKGKVKFSHTRYRALGRSWSRCSGSQPAGNFLSYPPVVGCHYFLPGLRSSSQPKNFAILRSVPSYTTYWSQVQPLQRLTATPPRHLMLIPMKKPSYEQEIEVISSWNMFLQSALSLVHAVDVSFAERPSKDLLFVVSGRRHHQTSINLVRTTLRRRWRTRFDGPSRRVERRISERLVGLPQSKHCVIALYDCYYCQVVVWRAIK